MDFHCKGGEFEFPPRIPAYEAGIKHQKGEGKATLPGLPLACVAGGSG